MRDGSSELKVVDESRLKSVLMTLIQDYKFSTKLFCHFLSETPSDADDFHIYHSGFEVIDFS